MEAVQLERLLADAFARAGARIDLQVRRTGTRQGRFAATVQSLPVEVEWLTVGWPRQVRELLDRPGRPDLVAAPELSPGARTLLAEAGLSWVDQTGNANIAMPGLYISPVSELSADQRAPS
jgi:hypothetical protein